MSNVDHDVTINVVNPSLSSRLSPPQPTSPSADVTDHTSDHSTTSLSHEPLCIPEQITPTYHIPKDNESQSDTSDYDNVSDAIFDKPHEGDWNDKHNISTDDTVINSASDNDHLHVSSSEESRTGATPTYLTMGNQSGKKKKGEDDDTPDESRTTCCEKPKKNRQNRNSKISNKSSRGDDDFDVDEVYPFDGRTGTSELDAHDNVELEPFEIVETDDIKFIAGAGTSDVIRNASESKFKTIPEEACLDEDEELRLFEQEEECLLQEAGASSIDRGDRLPESGTTTAHSTFEFKQVKGKKGKLKALREEPQSQTVYENVDMAYSYDSNKPKPVISAESSHSSGSSKSNSSSNSKSPSRKNSKDAIPKPARNGRKKSKTPENASYVNAEVTENKIEKNEVKLTETPKSANAVILTQTMFSKPKTDKDKAEQRKSSADSQGGNTYENVNLCAIMTPTGIVIGHKKSDASLAGNVIHAVDEPEPEPQGEPSASSSALHDTAKTESKSLKSTSPGKSQTELPIYETLNPVVVKDKETRDKEDVPPPLPDKTEPKYSEPSKPSKQDALAKPLTEDNNSKANAPNVLQVEGQDKSVPPPSPQGMEILEEEEEDEEEEDDDDIDADNDNRKSAEIVDFTENVCKRLSQLLEIMPQEDEEEQDEAADDSTDTLNRTFHVYEDVLDNTVPSSWQKESVVDTPEKPETTSSADRLDPPSAIQRNDSSTTLKRTSGDSNSYPMTGFLGSSDDDLPEFFDPRKDNEFTTSTTKSDKLAAVAKSEMRANPPKRDDYVDMTLGWKPESDPIVGAPRDNIQGLKLTQPTSETDTSSVTEIQDRTPTAEAKHELSALPEYANIEEESSVYHTYGRHSVTYTESDLDISEHRDDLSTDSMLADDEDEETMEILFTKTYTEPEEGGEVFLSCTVVNSAYKEEAKKSDTWLSDDALQYFEANAAEVMSTAFMRARKEMKDIQVCIQNLRHQMEHFHGDACDDVSLPDLPMDSLSPDYMLPRKAVTD